MGTNYYHIIQGPDACPHCGRSDNPDKRHIGKSGGGWCFSLHVYPMDNILDLPDWEKLFPSGVILDEYGDRMTPEEMSDIIRDRSNDKSWDERKWWGCNDEAHFHLRNGSQRGPNGLLRHNIGGNCIKHGAGTWDCIVGDFS